jgi:hypothetical protein
MEFGSRHTLGEEQSFTALGVQGGSADYLFMRLACSRQSCQAPPKRTADMGRVKSIIPRVFAIESKLQHQFSPDEQNPFIRIPRLFSYPSEDFYCSLTDLTPT